MSLQGMIREGGGGGRGGNNEDRGRTYSREHQKLKKPERLRGNEKK
jgi:hypothetical protein